MINLNLIKKTDKKKLQIANQSSKTQNNCEKKGGNERPAITNRYRNLIHISEIYKKIK